MLRHWPTPGCRQARAASAPGAPLRAVFAPCPCPLSLSLSLSPVLSLEVAVVAPHKRAPSCCYSIHATAYTIHATPLHSTLPFPFPSLLNSLVLLSSPSPLSFPTHPRLASLLGTAPYSLLAPSRNSSPPLSPCLRLAMLRHCVTRRLSRVSPLSSFLRFLYPRSLAIPKASGTRVLDDSDDMLAN
jgi:hypothetical protein